jgi:hypothetical protein
MSQTFDAPREQQASCERREPGALATVLALPARATAAVAWEPWLGEAAIARDYGVCTSDALARPPLAMVAARQPGELWQRRALPGHAAAHAVPSSRHNTPRAASPDRADHARGRAAPAHPRLAVAAARRGADGATRAREPRRAAPPRRERGGQPATVLPPRVRVDARRGDERGRAAPGAPCSQSMEQSRLRSCSSTFASVVGAPATTAWTDERPPTAALSSPGQTWWRARLRQRATT